jgi:hypothetical protein
MLALAVAGAGLTGCKEVEEPSTAGYEPAKVQPIGTGDAKRVIFTAEGARRVGLRTAPLVRSKDGSAVPYEALIYDGAGAAYVYTATATRTYERAPVTVARIEGDRVLLSRGPPPGTRVVTVGASEVYGAENGIEGGH